MRLPGPSSLWKDDGKFVQAARRIGAAHSNSAIASTARLQSLRDAVVGAQPEGEQRVGRSAAIAEEAGARLAGDADGLMPLQRIDVVETHLTPPHWCAV